MTDALATTPAAEPEGAAPVAVPDSDTAGIATPDVDPTPVADPTPEPEAAAEPEPAGPPPVGDASTNTDQSMQRIEPALASREWVNVSEYRRVWPGIQPEPGGPSLELDPGETIVITLPEDFEDPYLKPSDGSHAPTTHRTDASTVVTETPTA